MAARYAGGVMDEKGEASLMSSSSWWSTMTGDGDHWRRDDGRKNISMSTNDASRDNVRRITKRTTINNKMGIKTAAMSKNRRVSLEEYCLLEFWAFGLWPWPIIKF
jgi:hypothetical protein